MIGSPTTRLILRALLVGAATLGEQLQQNVVWDAALLRGAIVAAILAALEVFTPLNAVVGPNKTAAIHRLPRKAAK